MHGDELCEKNKMKTVIFCLLILLFTTECEKNGDRSSNDSLSTIFPYKIGDIWVYSVIDSMFTNQNLDSVKAYDMIVSVTGSTVLHGNTVANIWVYKSPLSADTNYVFQNGDTINFAVTSGNYVDIVRRYVMPLRLHNSWEYSSNSVHDVTIDSQANISVGINHFDDAFHLFGQPGRPDQIVTVDEWIKDSVGILKRYLNTSNTNFPLKHHTSWSIVNYSVR